LGPSKKIDIAEGIRKLDPGILKEVGDLGMLMPAAIYVSGVALTKTEDVS
jgi:hypothetical protein